MSRETWCFYMAAGAGLLTGAIFADVVGRAQLAIIAVVQIGLSMGMLAQMDQSKRWDHTRNK